MGTIFKVFIEFVQYCSCFMVWFFGCKACGILDPWPGIDPTSSSLEGEILTTEPPEKSPTSCFSLNICLLFHLIKYLWNFWYLINVYYYIILDIFTFKYALINFLYMYIFNMAKIITLGKISRRGIKWF